MCCFVCWWFGLVVGGLGWYSATSFGYLLLGVKSGLLVFVGWFGLRILGVVGGYSAPSPLGGFAGCFGWVVVCWYLRWFVDLRVWFVGGSGSWVGYVLG